MAQLLSMRTLHHLLASISIGLLLVRSESFHLHDNTFMLKVLTQNDANSIRNTGQMSDKAASKRPVCSFDHFKLIVLSLFGEKIFHLDEKVLNFTMRSVYKQITVSAHPVVSKTTKSSNSKHMESHERSATASSGDA